jgi:hypothetical protein
MVLNDLLRLMAGRIRYSAMCAFDDSFSDVSTHIHQNLAAILQ